MAVRRSDFDRVPVTPRLLRAIDRIVFLAAGPGKASIVWPVCETPDLLPAGQAVTGARRVELWYSPNT